MIARLRPSTKPSWLKPFWKTLRNFAKARGEPLLRKPTTGIARCCACAASDHAAEAPPRNTMNSRRLIFAPDARSLIRWHKLLALCDRAEENDHAGSKERAPARPLRFRNR